MATIERSATVHAPSNVVWETLADFAGISAWAPNVDHACLLSDQTEGVGMVRRIQTNGATVVETVETWEPGTALGYRISGLPPVIKSLTNVWRFVESDDSCTTTTLVTLTTEIDAGPRPPQQLIAKAVGKRLGTASDQMLVGLTALLNTSANAGTQ